MLFRIAALLIALLLTATASVATEHILGDDVSGTVTLSQEERAAIEPSLAHYYALSGIKPVLVNVIETSAAVGCRERCLADVTATMVQLMKAGVDNEEAGKEVVEALRAVKSRCDKRGIEAKGPEISRAVRARVENKYKVKKNGVVF